MKKLTITTRSKAIKECAFADAHINKFNSAKYAWKGKSAYYVGREISVPDRVIAVWVERRQDSDGAFAQFMSFSLNH